jgi:uncharacterized DUF497 family protein
MWRSGAPQRRGARGTRFGCRCAYALLCVVVPCLHQALLKLGEPSQCLVDIPGEWQYIVYVKYIHFTWSSVKDSQNRRKHGVSFEEARSAFFDEKARLIHDPEHSDQEDRFLLLGMSRRIRLLLVCHCNRESDEEIRIISARKATAAEAEQYWGY